MTVFNGINTKDAEIQRNVPMSAHTSFRIGGSADYFITVKNEDALKNILSICEESDIKLTVLGNGSNVLVSDSGIDGAVLRLGGDFCNIELADETSILCGAGAMLSQLCRFALENSLTGLEFAYGIPGTAGGAAFMNAGAYGGEMKDVLISCEHIDNRMNSGSLSGDEMQLSYRHSAYAENGFIITKLILKLEKGDRDTISAKMNELNARRREKQPLEYPSAGSVFKRPEGAYAGALIEKCGLKGYSIGGAQVSEKHAGFIINSGGATCEDVLSLVREIQKRVKADTGIQLECEIRRI